MLLEIAEVAIEKNIETSSIGIQQDWWLIQLNRKKM